MQFGYCVSMGAQDPAHIGYERIPALKKMGFDYVELPLAQVMSLGETAFREGPLEMLHRCEMPCLAMNNFFPATYRLTGPHADHDSAIAYAQAAMERAARLGAKVVVFGSSGARNRPLGTPLEPALDQLAALLSKLAVLAKGYGLTLVIEHLNKLESNVINRFCESCALARRVGHQSVGALMDTYHMNLACEPLTHVLDGGGLLRHVHVARTLSRGLPAPGDEEDYGRLFEHLARAGYQGTVSLEANIQADFEQEAAQALALLRSYAG